MVKRLCNAPVLVQCEKPDLAGIHLLNRLQVLNGAWISGAIVNNNEGDRPPVCLIYHDAIDRLFQKLGARIKDWHHDYYVWKAASLMATICCGLLARALTL